MDLFEVHQIWLNNSSRQGDIVLDSIAKGVQDNVASAALQERKIKMT